MWLLLLYLSERRQHSGFVARANMPTMFARMVSAGRPPGQAAGGYNLTKRPIAHSWMSDGPPLQHQALTPVRKIVTADTERRIRKPTTVPSAGAAARFSGFSWGCARHLWPSIESHVRSNLSAGRVAPACVLPLCRAGSASCAAELELERFVRAVYAVDDMTPAGLSIKMASLARCGPEVLYFRNLSVPEPSWQRKYTGKPTSGTIVALKLSVRSTFKAQVWGPGYLVTNAPQSTPTPSTILSTPHTLHLVQYSPAPLQVPHYVHDILFHVGDNEKFHTAHIDRVIGRLPGPPDCVPLHARVLGALGHGKHRTSQGKRLGIHVQEANVGARRVRVGTSTAMHCTRDPACPQDPVCFPRSLPQVMAAGTKFATAVADRVWSSVVELLHGLHDAGVAYIISRNWEQGFGSSGPSAHPDVDLLVSDYELTLRVIGGREMRHKAPGPVLVSKLVGSTVVTFDPRYVGDGYIDPAWATDAIRRRRSDGHGGTFVMAPIDHFFFLLYHALIHKKAIAPDYKNRLQHMGQMLLEGQGALEQEVPPGALLSKGSTPNAKRADRLALLQWYMSTHNYTFTRPTDPSVVFNIISDLVGESRRPCGVSELT